MGEEDRKPESASLASLPTHSFPLSALGTRLLNSEPSKPCLDYEWKQLESFGCSSQPADPFCLQKKVAQQYLYEMVGGTECS